MGGDGVAASPHGPTKSAQKLELNPAHIVASALAALGVAVVSSYFGINGTLIGAGAGSVFATVSTSLFEHGLHRTGQRIRRAGAGGNRRPAAELEAAELEAADQAHLPPRRLHWPRLAASAVIVLALVLGSLTAVEVVARRPIASLVTGRPPQSATTLGAATGIGSAPAQERSAPESLTPSPGRPARTTESPSATPVKEPRSAPAASSRTAGGATSVPSPPPTAGTVSGNGTGEPGRSSPSPAPTQATTRSAPAASPSAGAG